MNFLRQLSLAVVLKSFILITLMIMGRIVGANDSNAYWSDSSGNIVHSRTGECLKTRQWTPQQATRECDPELFARYHQKAYSQSPTAAETVAEYIAAMNIVKKLVIDTETYFYFDSAKLRPEAEKGLKYIAIQIRSMKHVDKIRIVGYADRIGTDQYNDKLALARAESVEKYLTAELPIKLSKYVVHSKGESDPNVKCIGFETTPNLVDCLQPNRRVEIEVIGSVI